MNFQNYKIMNQTPIQKAIEEIQKTYEYKHDLGLSPSNVMRILKQLLPYEEEVIKDAFVAGDERGTKDIPFNAEQYFNQTFKQ